jgi:hypothetical protein
MGNNLEKSDDRMKGAEFVHAFRFFPDDQEAAGFFYPDDPEAAGFFIRMTKKPPVFLSG